MSQTLLKAGPDRRRESTDIEQTIRVIDYRLCLELLSLQNLKQENAKQDIWHSCAEKHLPWIDPRKLRKYGGADGKTWQHSVRFGIIEMKGLVANLRFLLGVGGEEDLDVSGHAIILAITTEHRVFPTGDVSFSSLPWAMGRIKEAGQTDEIDFSDFSGTDGFEKSFQKKLKDCLIELQVLEPGQLDKEGREKPAQGLRALNFADFRDLETLLFTECRWQPGPLLQTWVCTQGR